MSDSVPLLALRCAACRRRRRAGSKTVLRARTPCPDCRTVWAAGEGPSAVRGEPDPTTRDVPLPPV